MLLTPRRATLALVLSAYLLGGCQYTVHVRNATDRPVHVQLIQRNLLNPDWVLDSGRVDPGSRIRLGPSRVSGGKILLEAGEQTPTHQPATLRVRAGETSALITYAADGRTPALRKDDEPADPVPTK